MDNKGNTGLNGLDTSGRSCSRKMSTSPAVESRIDRAQGASRPKSHLSRLGGDRSAHMGERHSRAVVALIVFAAAIVLVSAIVLGSVGTQERETAKALAPPGPPYPVAGYTRDSTGAVLFSCALNITDLNTGQYNNTIVSSATTGFYSVNLGAFASWTAGDIIKVTAVKGALVGENQSAVSGSFLAMDVTLDVAIPEFPMAIIPVTGMIALIAVVSLRRRAEEQ